MENAIQRAVILCEDEHEISHDLLAIDLDLVELEDPQDFSILQKTLNSRQISSEPAEDLSLEDYFQRFVLEHQEIMSETELARKLGVSRKCLWERRQRLGIPRKKTTAQANAEKQA
jgi:DNA-binding NtrC family response regulator